MAPSEYTPQQREEDQRLAAQSRMEKLVGTIATEDRARFWDTVGFNIREGAGIDRLRRILNSAEALGINLNSPDSIEEFRSTIRFARDLQRKTQEAGTETRKGLVHGIVASIVAAIVGAVAAFFSIKGAPH